MKLWQKDTSTNEKIDHFTVGNDRTYDLVLAPYDCIASKAHAKMLGEIGLLTSKEVKDLADALDCLLYTSPSPRDRTRSRMPSSA